MAAANHNQGDKLNKVQRITEAMATTPTAAMETLLNLAPLHILVTARALGGAYHKKKNFLEEDKTRERHSKLFEEIDNQAILRMGT